MNKLVLLSTLSLAFVMAGCSLMPSTETNTGDMATTGTETMAPTTETPAAEVVMTGTETTMTGVEAPAAEATTGMAQ